MAALTERDDSGEVTVSVIPGRQRLQSSPQKKQESVLCRRSELYVLVAFLAESGRIIRRCYNHWDGVTCMTRPGKGILTFVSQTDSKHNNCLRENVIHFTFRFVVVKKTKNGSHRVHLYTYRSPSCINVVGTSSNCENCTYWAHSSHTPAPQHPEHVPLCSLWGVEV